MGGAEKVAKKAIMKDIHDSWKARWWGLPKLQNLRTLDLRGEGRGRQCGGSVRWGVWAAEQGRLSERVV